MRIPGVIDGGCLSNSEQNVSDKIGWDVPGDVR